MFEIISRVAQRALSWGASFALRWYWSEQRLASDVRTVLPGDRQAVRIDGGENPSVAVWLELQNLTPFPIEIDRLFGEIFCGCRIASFVYLDRRLIQPLKTEIVHIQADMTDGQARSLRISQEKRVRLTLNGFIACRVRGFRLYGRNIESGNVEITNIKAPS